MQSQYETLTTNWCFINFGREIGRHCLLKYLKKICSKHPHIERGNHDLNVNHVSYHSFALESTLLLVQNMPTNKYLVTTHRVDTNGQHPLVFHLYQCAIVIIIKEKLLPLGCVRYESSHVAKFILMDVRKHILFTSQSRVTKSLAYSYKDSSFRLSITYFCFCFHFFMPQRTTTQPSFMGSVREAPHLILHREPNNFTLTMCFSLQYDTTVKHSEMVGTVYEKLASEQTKCTELAVHR